MRLWPVLLAFTVFLFGAIAAVAQEGRPFPLKPPDRSSPRATLKSFIEDSSRGATVLREGTDGGLALSWLQRADQCLDLNEVSPDRLVNVRVETGVLLYEVLTRAGIPELSEVPDATEMEALDRTTWFLPRTEIAIHLVTEGDLAGTWLFSPRTVANARLDFEAVRHLPPRPEFVPGTYEIYASSPNLPRTYAWVQELPDWARLVVLGNSLWKWVAVLLVLGLGGLLIWIGLRAARRHVLDPEGEAPMNYRLLLAAGVAVATPLVAQTLIDEVIGFRFEAEAVLSKGLFLLAALAGVVFVMLLSEAGAHFVVSARKFREQPINRNLVFVIARILGAFACLFVILESAEFLGVQFAPLLAGIGVGGLALALAVRPTLENVIGGLTLFADRPLRIGDYCEFGTERGTVEQIGLRSTRLRRLDDKLITVPNAELAQLKIVNFGMMRQRLYRTKISLRYETTAEQLDKVLSELRQMLEDHPAVSPYRAHVRFVSFEASAFGIEMFAYIQTADWLEYRAIAEELNLKVIQVVEGAGASFAFPSQTTYLGRDPFTDQADQPTGELVQSDAK